MWKEVTMASVLTLVAASSAPAQGGADARWSASFSAGTVPSVSGLYHGSGSGTVLNLPTQVEERDYSDMRWTGDLSDVDGLAGTGLENLNDSSSRWTLPIMGTLTFKF